MLHGVVGEHGPDLERLDSFGSEQSSEGRLTVGRLRFATSLLLLLGGSSSLAVPRQDGDQTWRSKCESLRQSTTEGARRCRLTKESKEDPAVPDRRAQRLEARPESLEAAGLDG